MNKAEEQYFYIQGRSKAQTRIMYDAADIELTRKHYNIDWLKTLRQEILNLIDSFKGRPIEKGVVDYSNSILHAIDGNLITDWPSFVTYMTGEKYEG